MSRTLVGVTFMGLSSRVRVEGGVGIMATTVP